MSRHLTPEDTIALAHAVARIEKRTLTRRLLTCAGMPADWALRVLPESGRTLIAKASRRALKTALKAALYTLDPCIGKPYIWPHCLAVATLGAAGGAMGLVGLAFELPVTTTAILRSIAAIARSEGENLANPATGLACIEVFSLGSSSTGESLESPYLATRALLAKQIAAATDYIATRTADRRLSSQLLKLIDAIAPRFGLMVEEQLLSKAVPIIGAVGGAAVNTAFMAHFQDVAAGHFAVRRLERRYGPDAVASAYRRARSVIIQRSKTRRTRQQNS